MSQALALSAPAIAFAPAAPRAIRLPAVRKIWLGFVAAAEGVTSFGVIEAGVTLATLGFSTAVIALFW